MLGHLGRNQELGIGRPAVNSLRLGDLVVAQRFTVGLRGAGLVRRAKANDAFDDDQRRAIVVGEETLIGVVDRGQVVGILHGEHMPTQAAESRRHVFAEGEIGLALDRDVVVVVDPAEVRELQVAGERRGFVGDAFHHVAIAALRPNVVVEQLEARLVEAGREPTFGDRHADAVAAALAERAGRGFDARRVAVLGVARRAAAPLAELLDVFERNGRLVGHFSARVLLPDPCQVDQRVDQHRRMAAGEDVSIAIRPMRLGRIVAQIFRPKVVGDWGQRHRCARMA